MQAVESLGKVGVDHVGRQIQIPGRPSLAGTQPGPRRTRSSAGRKGRMTATPGGGQGPARGASRRRRDKSGAVGSDPGGSRQAGDQRRKGDPAVATNRRRACGVAIVFMQASCGWMRGCTGRAIAREFDHCARAAPALSMPAWRTCHAWLSEGGTPAWVEGVGLTGADNRARVGATSTNQRPRVSGWFMQPAARIRP